MLGYIYDDFIKAPLQGGIPVEFDIKEYSKTNGNVSCVAKSSCLLSDIYNMIGVCRVWHDFLKIDHFTVM